MSPGPHPRHRSLVAIPLLPQPTPEGESDACHTPFGATLANALGILVASNPDVRIFIVNQ
jgi:hypothetical protein